MEVLRGLGLGEHKVGAGWGGRWVCSESGHPYSPPSPPPPPHPPTPPPHAGAPLTGCEAASTKGEALRAFLVLTSSHLIPSLDSQAVQGRGSHHPPQASSGLWAPWAGGSQVLRGTGRRVPLSVGAGMADDFVD